jgi:two-component system response regulator DesR
MTVPMIEELEHPLSPRETELLQALADGNTLARAADELGIAISTAKTHMQRIQNKMGVHSQAEAVADAFRAGWIT